MRSPSKLSLVLTSVILVLSYQNCGEFFVDASKMSRFSSLGATESAGAALVPSSDKFDASCRTNSNYDACVFQQNPLSRSGAALSADPSARQQQLSSQSLYGVKLTSLVGNGKLENSTISVQSLKTPPVSTTAASLKVEPGLSNSSAFEQANVYYWVNRAAEYFDARTDGALPAKGKGIKIIVDDTLTGYDSSKNTIRLKRTDTTSVAWSGDLAVHLFGIANLMLANPTGWTTLSSTKHATCSAMDKGCCTAAVGCGNAIRFGVGEYFAASLFPGRTRIGEALVNNGNPQIIGGISRDLASLSSTAATTTFTTAAGYAQALGLVYASMWFEIRKTSETQSAEIDRLFLEHLSLLDGNDDFRTAFAKVKTIDARLFGGRHSSKFDAQLTTRGI